MIIVPDSVCQICGCQSVKMVYKVYNTTAQALPLGDERLTGEVLFFCSKHGESDITPSILIGAAYGL